MQAKYIVFATAFVGLVFSGYQSAVKFFSQVCAIDSCPYFLGYPACYYGFVMFFMLTVLSLFLIFRPGSSHRIVGALIVVGCAGVLFSGWYTWGELPTLFSKGLRAYALGLPTCAWGLVMYIGVSVASLIARKQLDVTKKYERTSM
jgi:uncharacterized membrane protein